ncbi:MoeB/thiF family protein [hydrothermal vent metagenome]|uniref:MoeB/thiF family protein n=1 Tax=hydrothermal vent metagenome TaxID=652676 RepID=A0A1W1BB32_9ZZZZ
MNHGSKLSCYGIPGDGCGGGREFFIENETLFAKDPVTKECIKLLEGIKGAKAIAKNGCNITIECEEERIVFNLSTFQSDSNT